MADLGLSEVPFQPKNSDTQLILGLDVPLSGGYQFKTIETNNGPRRSAAAPSIAAVYIDGKPDWSRTDEIQLIERTALERHPLNPRQFANRVDMLNSAISIRLQGVHTPLDICQLGTNPAKGLLLSGHRRLWTCEALELDLIPCRLDPRRVLTEIEQREALIRANEGQQRPAPINRAQSILEFMACSNLNQTQAAQRLCIAPATLGKLLKLLTLPEVVQKRINEGELNESIAFHLTRLGNPDLQIQLAESAVKFSWSADKMRRVVLERIGKSRVTNRFSDSFTRREAPQLQTKEFSLDGEITLRISSSRTSLTPANLTEAIRETMMQIPMEFEVHHGKENEYKQQCGFEGGLPSGQSSGLSIKDSEGESPERTAATNLQSPAELKDEDPLGLKAPVTYQFPIILSSNRELRSVAAASVNAVYIDGYPDWSRSSEVQLLSIHALKPHPLNPRKAIPREAMRDSVLSIKSSGIHTPLLVSRYPNDPQSAYILGGHRRTWVSRQLGVDLVPCRLDPRGILTEVQIRESLLSDNEGQVKTAPIDRALSYRDYLKVSKLSMAVAAHRLGISESQINKALYLLKLPAQVQHLINSGGLSEAQGFALCAHSGSEQAVVALAIRAVSEGLSATRLQAIAKRSAPDLSVLSGQSLLERERHFAVGEERRVHVEISSRNSLPPGDELVRILSRSLQDRDFFTQSAKVLQQTKSSVVEEADVELINVIPSFHPKSDKRIVSCLNDLIKQDGDRFMISSDVARALQKQFTNKELKKLTVTDQDLTEHLTARWHKLHSVRRREDKVSLAQVITFWSRSLSVLDQRGNFIDEKLIETTPVDTAHFQGAQRKEIVSEIESRLARVGNIIKNKILPMVQAAIKAEQGLAGDLGKLFLTSDELEASGFKVSGDFKTALSRWRREQLTSNQSAGSPSTYELTEVHRFLSDAVKKIIELSGGNLEGAVSQSDLRSNSIPFSALNGTKKTGRFQSRLVFNELHERFLKLNTIISEIPR